MASLRTQVRIFKPCILCRILTAPVGRVWRFTHFYSVAPLLEKWFTCHHSTPYFFIILFPTAFYDRLRMTGRYLLPFYKKLFFVSAHTCPFRRLTPPPSPTSGDGLRLAFYRLSQQSSNTVTETQFTPAVILERWIESE